MSIPPKSKPALPRYKVSLQEHLIGKLDEPRRPGLEELHRHAINVMRKHSAQAVIRITLQEIQADSENRQEVIQRLPWLHLLLVKWALQDRRVGLNFGPRHNIYTAQEQRALVSKLWSVSPAAVKGTPAPGALMRLLRRTMHVQFDFQRYTDASFLRWPALLQRLPPGHTARRLFEDAMGMSPQIYAELATAVFSVAMNQNNDSTLDLPTLRSLYPPYGEQLVRFLELFSRNLVQLRAELQADSALRTRGTSELYEFPYLQRFPLLDLGDGQLRTWHPLVFARGIENAIHHRLSAFGQSYTDIYSRLFEDYVTELATATYPEAITEASYRRQVGGGGSAFEASIPFGSCNVFVEAKLSLFHDDVILVDDPELLRHKTERVRKAIAQGMSVSKAVRDPHSPLYSAFAVAQTDYMLIVTSRDLLLVTAERMQELMPEQAILPSTVSASEHLPMHHIFIVDVQDYELVMANVAAGHVNLPDLLSHAAQANRNHFEGRLHLSEHMVREKAPHRIAPLLSTEFAAARKRVELALGDAPDAALGPKA